ncbi:MAG: hypothetical protein ACPGCP_03970, partial [Candidatus Nanopelagicales bacterium]
NVQEDFTLRRERLLVQYNDDLARANAAYDEGDYRKARESAVTARLRVDRDKGVLPADRYSQMMTQIDGLLDRIAEVEEVSVGESELSNWLMQQAPRYGMAPDALAQALVESGQVSMALSDIRRSKALALVLENATVTDSNGDAVDLQALESELNEAMQAAQMAQLQAQMAAAESGQ